MADENAARAAMGLGQFAAVLPRCQHCKADPAPIIPSFISMGGGRAVVFHCGNPECRAIHSVQLTGIEQHTASQGRILVPS